MNFFFLFSSSLFFTVFSPLLFFPYNRMKRRSNDYRHHCNNMQNEPRKYSVNFWVRACYIANRWELCATFTRIVCAPTKHVRRKVRMIKNDKKKKKPVQMLCRYPHLFFALDVSRAFVCVRQNVFVSGVKSYFHSKDTESTIDFR